MVETYFKGNHNVQIGPNENLMDWTYVGNIAHAHLLATQALLATASMKTVPLDTERVDGEAFFITNDEPCYWWDFARAVWAQCGPMQPAGKAWVLPRGLMMAVAGITETIGWLGFKTGHLTKQVVYYATLQKYHNIDKAKKRLGYRPLVSLQEGVRRGVAAVMEDRKAEAAKKGQ